MNSKARTALIVAIALTAALAAAPATASTPPQSPPVLNRVNLGDDMIVIPGVQADVPRRVANQEACRPTRQAPQSRRST